MCRLYFLQKNIKKSFFFLLFYFIGSYLDLQFAVAFILPRVKVLAIFGFYELSK